MAKNKAKEELYKEYSEINQKLARLTYEFDKEQSNLVFMMENMGGDYNYGHVGDAGRINILLQEVSDIVFKEGEYA